MSAPSVFFIATAHDEYRERRFPPGSTVIDPWRMVEDQPGVTVRRLGENKPALISILVPSRGRPVDLAEMVTSAWNTALYKRRIEFVVRLDLDDPMIYTFPMDLPILLIQGDRELLSSCWNECADAARGEILMHAGDDIRFETNGWDQQVRQAFAAIPDRIALVQGDDLSVNRDSLATHGFLHRRWVEAVGYFVPPLFSCDWNDVWLTEVADRIGRRIKLPFVTEHRHYSFGKREKDATDEEREERGKADDAPAIFKRTWADRERDAIKLREAMFA